MRALLAARTERYRTIYDCVPQFRAGLHGGSVVTTWVGLTKMELACHGDALNVTARIQALCKERREACLVSGALMERITLPDSLHARPLGVVELRGKDEPLEVYGVGAGDTANG
jgi:adenylate cyclase